MTKDHRHTGKPPPAAHIREFQLPDGRRIAVDRRSVAFAAQCKEQPTKRTVLAFRAGKAGPCPVMAPIDDVLPWWTGEEGKPGTRDKRKPSAPAQNGNGKWQAPTRPGSPPAKSGQPAAGGKKLSEAEAERRAKALAAAKSGSAA